MRKSYYAKVSNRARVLAQAQQLEEMADAGLAVGLAQAMNETTEITTDVYHKGEHLFRFRAVPVWRS